MSAELAIMNQMLNKVLESTAGNSGAEFTIPINTGTQSITEGQTIQIDPNGKAYPYGYVDPTANVGGAVTYTASAGYTITAAQVTFRLGDFIIRADSGWSNISVLKWDSALGRYVQASNTVPSLTRYSSDSYVRYAIINDYSFVVYYPATATTQKAAVFCINSTTGAMAGYTVSAAITPTNTGSTQYSALGSLVRLSETKLMQFGNFGASGTVDVAYITVNTATPSAPTISISTSYATAATLGLSTGSPIPIYFGDLVYLYYSSSTMYKISSITGTATATNPYVSAGLPQSISDCSYMWADASTGSYTQQKYSYRIRKNNELMLLTGYVSTAAYRNALIITKPVGEVLTDTIYTAAVGSGGHKSMQDILLMSNYFSGDIYKHTDGSYYVYCTPASTSSESLIQGNHYLFRIVLDNVNFTYTMTMLIGKASVGSLVATSYTGSYSASTVTVINDQIVCSVMPSAACEVAVVGSPGVSYTKTAMQAMSNIAANTAGIALANGTAFSEVTKAPGTVLLGKYIKTDTNYAVEII